MIKKLATMKEIATLNDSSGVVIIKDEPGYDDGIYNITTAGTELLLETGGSAPLPVLTEYPEKDASKAGQRFLYKGTEWSYMTQEEIDALEWNETEGFPAPINKIFNPFLVTSYSKRTIHYGVGRTSSYTDDVVVDTLGYGLPNLIKQWNEAVGSSITDAQIIKNIVGFKNIHLLTNLEDAGTSVAINFSSSALNMSKETIDNLFTQLPETIKTATINVTSNPGSATCDATIATSKGYIVIK